MTDQLRFRILGCGSSGGVPRLGGNWGACDPNNPKNARTRCSLLVERQSKNGRTQVLIDTSPDMRAQLLQAQVGRLDAVLYTHDHADHVHGLDDLRMIVFNRRSRLPVWANQVTSAGLLSRFSYAFKQPEGSAYPPILELNHIEGPVKVDGAGGQAIRALLNVPAEEQLTNAGGNRLHHGWVVLARISKVGLSHSTIIDI